MPKKQITGGGWPAIRYVWKASRSAGGIWRMWRALRSKNACKTCALGMGGQRGGMVNERGRFPEVCKKSVQAMAADMQPAIEDSFWKRNSISFLKTRTPRELEAMGRLAHPVVARPGSDHYEVVEWSQAMAEIADCLNAIEPDESFWYFSGRSSNEAGFLLQIFARLYGTNNVNNCSYYCHQASGVGLTSAVGSGTATVVLEDLEQADLVFLIGGNPASNHPRLMTLLADVRRRGGDVVVVNPVIEPGLVRFRIPSRPISLMRGSPIASLYLQPHIGGDLALLTALARRVDELGEADETFLSTACEGFSDWRSGLRELDPQTLASAAGVSSREIDEAAERYAASKKTIFAWTMGITHHAHGVQNVQAIANLALMRGMVGRPGAGLLPIRGHSNVQGIGSVGVTPALKQAIRDRLERTYCLTMPERPGLDTLACIEAAHQGRMKLGFCLGGNLYGSNPDSTYAAEALGRLETVAYLSTTLNTGHAHGTAGTTWILPVAARDEEPQPTTQESMFNYVRMSEGGRPRHAGTRSEVTVVADLAERVLGRSSGLDWPSMRNTGNIRHAIANVVPGFEKLEEIDQTREEFQIGGRTFHEPRFPTLTGRARLHRHELPPADLPDGALRLMTVRSEGQFNTVVYEEEDLYRGQTRRDVILVHPHDLQERSLQDGQPVLVRSETGTLEPIVATAFEAIRPGNALMYYPEANKLVPRRVDSQSRTPAFKGIVVYLKPCEDAGGDREAEIERQAERGPSG